MRIDNMLNVNWTKPFLKNFICSLNSSMYGISKKMYSKSHNVVEFPHIISSEAQYGILTSLLLIFCIDKIFSKRDDKYEKRIIKLHCPRIVNVQTCITALSFVAFLFFSPLILLTFLFYYVYKSVIKIIIIIKLGPKFVKMMDGMDTVWAMEDEHSKSIINVIFFLSAGNTLENNNLLTSLKSDVKSKIFGSKSSCEKMLYKRASFLGYHYWMLDDDDDIDIERYITSMRIPRGTELTEDALKRYIEADLNADLPYGNTSTWEIKISQLPIKDTNHYPVLFRIHHSLGDGVALLKLLLNTIGRTDITRIDEDNLKLKKMEATCPGKMAKLVALKIINALVLILRMPGSLVRQAMLPPDANILHGPTLNGKKIITWLSDRECGDSLLSTIKRIKAKIPSVTFSEIILIALSSTGAKYFKKHKTNEYIPNKLTAVVPARMKHFDFDSCSNGKISLENNFSVAMLTVPLVACDKEADFLRALMSVRRETRKLRRGVDFYVNFWLMKIGGSLLPEFVLKPMLTSVQASLVVSNIPGPSDVYFCDDYKLERITFFIPNRGTTGIGITVISCNDRINLGMMIDSAIVGDENCGRFILKNMIEEIKTLDRITSASATFKKINL